jgi:hypothetical protein
MLVGASGNELFLEVEVEGQPYQLLVDCGATISLVKRGVSQAALFPTDVAARGITGTKLKASDTRQFKLS